ncbi:MAG: hypothetical protein HC838_05070 [Spirulinaceae cyanobacterium RM2_2_10]|nr:hypothetical protein [Spirulinaceae cyanobacterium RM2_2_10]
MSRDRRESLKAAALAGTTFAIVIGLSWLVPLPEFGAGIPLPGTALPLQLATTALTGGVFGITYRYVRREDRNPHLDSGAVAAFAIARASPSITATDDLSPWAIAILSSGLGFWLASVVLNLALRRQWVQCCPPRTEPH